MEWLGLIKLLCIHKQTCQWIHHIAVLFSYYRIRMDFFFWMGCLLQNEIVIIMFFLVITYFQYYQSNLAYENSRFSSLFSARDVSRGGTSATQRQKFHGDDVNQYLHNTSGSHGVPHPNLSNFTFPLIDFTRVFFSSANELQQNSNASSREQYIFLQFWLFC